ncbi:ferritin-like domain-containing protein [Jannaschia sp. LMIT008]|uniref:ferritin-like domain-containing protein n=1 Tax=Jannaschia maritima TaxID=3032585 RepID=UPI002810D55A|nr:ferritin-like domain-containing protein [Jannaschia sp. LMIT008]
MNTLKDLYLDQIQDLYSATRQSRDIVIELEKAATNEELKEALHKGHNGISAGMDVMAGIARKHDVSPDGEHCKGMEGLVAEARAHVLEEEFGDSDVKDAMIITQYQRMAHYAIAGYGCVKAFAERLGLDEDVQLLDRHLSNTYDGDEKLTDLAKGGINKAAAA